MGTSLKNPLTYAGVYCSDTLFIMQVLYRIIYCDDNVVMMPKGREQVLRSTWGCQIARRTPVRWREKKNTYLLTTCPSSIA